MDTLPILKKNAYLTVLIKDNYLFSNLAFSDLLAQKTYILSDSTDLSPLKFRLDDFGFTKNFWSEYFNSLEEVYDWDIVDRQFEGVFKIKDFEREEVGISGIKVIVDDNQPFFKNIFTSIKEFSKDISLKVLDDRYIESICKGLINRLGYKDILWIDLDISHFSVFRAREINTVGGIFNRDVQVETVFNSSKIGWSNEIGLVDFIRSSKVQAFLSSDTSIEDISNKWANFIAHGSEYISDPVLHDLLRAFTTLQLLSIKQSNREKLNDLVGDNYAIFVSGNIPKLMSKRELLLSIIDGLELEGIPDLYIDTENKILTFGKNFIEKEESNDIIVFKGDILPYAHKIVIPEVPHKSMNKVVFGGRAIAQNVEPKEIYALGSSFQIMKVPNLGEKVVVEGELKNGAVFPHLTSNRVDFMSTASALRYEYLVIDGRARPIVYGPSVKDNAIKFKIWGDGD